MRLIKSRLSLTLVLLAGSLITGAAQQLPLDPIRERGQGVYPVYEGWYKNADGSFTFLLGYFNRNTREALDVPGSPRVVHVPGHTEGVCALYFEDRGVVCTGDSMVTRNPLTGRLGPQIMPSYLNVSSARAMESLDRLEDLPAMTVLPGHGEPFRDGTGDAVRRAREAGIS